MAELSKKDEQDIERAITTFVESMDALNIHLTEDEISAKRKELTEAVTGQLEPVSGGLREARSWDQAQAMMADPESGVSALDDYQLVEKDQLIGVPMLINKFWFTDSPLREGSQYVTVRAVVQEPGVLTPTGERASLVVFTDGSTGILEQLREYAKMTGKAGGLVVRHGLRVSRYNAEVEGGMTEAETYYLN